MKKPFSAAKLVTILFLALILFFTVSNVLILKTPIKDFLTGKIDFATFTTKMADTYRNALEQREWFISLNGAYARATGASVSNGIILMENGMLTEEQGAVDPTFGAQQIAALHEAMQAQGTEFLYVQSPRKPGLDESLIPEGTTNESNASADKMVALLTRAGVPLMDLRPYVSADAEQLEQYFYVTDHHWTAEGAFKAFELLTAWLQEQFPEQEILSQATQRDNWQRNVKEDFFLGSHGRRVGTGYAGVEDLLWLTPRFDTNLSCAVPEQHIFRKGTFFEAALDTSYLDMEPDYYNTNPYCIHTGGDYAHVQFRNGDAPSDLKVMVVQDSFGLALEGLLATVFREVDTIDLRINSEYSLKERIDNFRPDVVIVMYNPSLLGNQAVFDFGLEEEAPAAGPVIAEKQDITLAAQPENNYLHAAVSTLEPGKTYTLTIDDIRLTAGAADCITAGIYDAQIQWLREYYTPDLDYIRETGGGYRWVFNTPETAQGELRLLLYAGLPGQTAGVGAEFLGVTLQEGAIYE